MLKTISFLFIFLISFTVNCQSVPNDYEELWQKVEKYEGKGLPKSALQIVENILEKAEKENNSPQIVKSLLFQSKYILTVEEGARLKVLADFNRTIAASSFPTKNILEGILAKMYWQYFQANRYRFYQRTKTKEKVDSTGFRTWDLQTLMDEVNLHFQRSLENSDHAKQLKLKDFAAILEEAPDSKKLRPTLFDFLRHLALEFYKNPENKIAEPVYKFEVDRKNFLETAEDFVKLEINAKDSLSLSVQALKIYQDLIRFHLKDESQAALADVNMARLNYVQSLATFVNSEEILLKTLKAELENSQDSEAGALYTYEIASLYYEMGKEYNPKTNPEPRWKIKEAFELCETCISEFPKTKGAEKCAVLREMILEKNLEIFTEKILPVQKNAKMLVSYKNIDRLNFELYTLSEKEIDSFQKFRSKLGKIGFIKNLKPINHWDSNLRNEGDFREHSTEILLPKMENGHYLIYATTANKEKEIVAFEMLQVTDLAVIEKTRNGKALFQIVDRNNGKPVTGAKVKMSYKYFYRGKTHVKNMVSDSLGTIGLTRVGLNYHDIVFDIKHKEQTASFGEFYAYIYYPEESDYATDHSFLFTDRSIYRPGQTVFFKGIVMKQLDGKSEVQPGVPVNVTLYNANRDDVATQEFTTNEFGSVHGEFILPSSGLTGQFSLEIDGQEIDFEDRTYFSVEEYKRPTFESNFEPVKKTFRVNDSVIVHGSAVAYAGSKITGAKVVYRVVRKANFPYWYGWWRPQMRSEPQEIAHGETITDENGKFEIEFKAVPDEDIYKETLPVFNYEITADITDINGETRSTKSVVKVGYHTLNIGLQVQPKLNKNLKTHELTLSTENLNGEFVPAEGTIRVYKLKAPESVVRPRPWPTPDYQEFSRAEFKTLFPHAAYKNEAEPEKWEKGELVFEADFNTEKSKKIALGKTKKWKSGAYKIELKSIDPYGQEILVEERTFLFSPNEKVLADNKLFSIKTDKAEYQPGETAKITLASAAENLWVTVLVEKDHKIVQSHLVQLNNGKESLSIPITESDLGGFAILYSYATFNSFTEGNLIVSVPFPSYELQIETLSFRDKLKPGEEETWSFHIKGPNGEKVSAELLASMYDASLDQFKPHQWNFQPIFQNTYKPRIRIDARRSFDLGYFRIYEPKSSKLHFPKQNYDQLNWFGFNFGNFRLFQREYLQKKYTEVEPNMVGSFKAAIPDGIVQGTVFDRLSGMPLAGVNIVIDGTTTGTQTDFDGKFSLKVKSGDALIFSYIAYEDIVINVGKDNHYEIRMVVSSAELEQVVVTAFGIESKKAINSEITLRGNAAISGSQGALVVIDGKIATPEQLRKLGQKNIGNLQFLKGPSGNALYGAQGKNGVIVVTTKKETNFENVQIRKNLQETAYFFPELKTDEEGNVSFHFTTPEALTTWKLQLLAHTKNLQSATLIKEAITQKELMVLPNFPRFLRVGDSIQLSTKIANLTEKTLMGDAVLKLYDAISGAEISSSLILSEENLKTFSVIPKGNTTVHWKLNIPKNLQAVRYKIIAKSGNFGDGMQAFLPVLSNRILVTETMPMWVRSNQSKTFTLEKLKNNISPTLKHHQLTLEITSNPAWYAVQALPYLMEYPYECNEQTFSRYFANALASHVVNSNPRIKEVFQQWKNSDALISNLEKNKELKSLLIRETPWVRDAESETEQKKRIALLFNLNKMSSELNATKTKLQQNQLSSGAWPWFDGGRESRFITQYIIAGFGHLKKLGVEVPTDERMIRKAIGYLDSKFLEEYRRITRFDKNADLNKNHLTHSQIHYLYMRSFFPEIDKSTEVEEISDYYYSQMKKYWLAGSLYEKGLMSLVLYRNEAIDVAKSILNSLKETSVVSDELGRYWKENKPSWFWYEAPIETQSLMIEVFSEIEANFETIDALKIWLLKNKQTNRWSSTKSTAWAVYSLLLQGNDWLGNSEMVHVEIAGKPLSESISENVEYEAGTGYFKTTWSRNEIVPEMATVKMEKKGEGIAWGALYWQYFEDMDKITTAETPLKLHKKLFLKTNTDTGEILTEIGPDTEVKIGDLIRIRIELKVDRPMEFLHLKDMRTSGLEPVNVLSEYKWQDGLGYYESTKDASTDFFFDYVGKGVYVFEYDLRASNSGNFSNGITTIQCMYAPEFSSHSEGSRMKIQP